MPGRYNPGKNRPAGGGLQEERWRERALFTRPTKLPGKRPSDTARLEQAPTLWSRPGPIKIGGTRKGQATHDTSRSGQIWTTNFRPSIRNNAYPTRLRAATGEKPKYGETMDTPAVGATKAPSDQIILTKRSGGRPPLPARKAGC